MITIYYAELYTTGAPGSTGLLQRHEFHNFESVMKYLIDSGYRLGENFKEHIGNLNVLTAADIAGEFQDNELSIWDSEYNGPQHYLLVLEGSPSTP